MFLKRLNAMLLLLLNLLFHCELLRCDEFKSANLNEPPHRRHAYTAKRYNNYMNHATTEVLLTTPLGNGDARDNPPSLLSLSSPFADSSTISTSLKLIARHSLASGLSPSSKSNSPPVFSQLTASTVKVSTQIQTSTVSISKGLSFSSDNIARSPVSAGDKESLSKETSYSSDNIARSHVSTSIKESTTDDPSYLSDNIARFRASTNNQSMSCSKPPQAESNLTKPGGPVSYPASTPPFTFDPSVAKIANKWLQGLTSLSSTPKMLVPKLTSIFDYDLTTQIQLGARRYQKNQRRKSKTRQLEREASTKPRKSKRRYPEPEATIKTFWHNPPKLSSLPTTTPTQMAMTATKQRLKPGLLLGKATISGIKNKEDVGEKQETISRSAESKWILRMHKIVEVTKKEWYSDRMQKESKRAVKELEQIEQELKRAETEAPTTVNLLQGQTIAAAPSVMAITTSPTTEYLFTIKKDLRQDTYMIVFVKELTRLIATKKEEAVHDVIKHADQILHGVYKSRQLQWVHQPFIDFTKHVAKSITNSEIGFIQVQAADLYHVLRYRQEMLSEELNSALEYADQLYDNDEGEQLLKVLSEFAAFPNTTLNGYWLCNSLINAFLRPYRRLTEWGQRQTLMDFVTLAMKTSFTPSGTNGTNALRQGVRQVSVPPVEAVIGKNAFIITTRIPRQRKRKHRHRSHIRKRGRKRYLIYRTKPQIKYTNQGLMLRSVTPRTPDAAQVEWPFLL